jgi:hypothetical protein
MDYVKIIKWEEVYPLYTEFVEKFKPDYASKFIYNSSPDEKSLFRVLFTAGHLEFPDRILHIVEDLESKQVHVISKDGIRTATAHEIADFEDYPATLMYIFFDQYGEVRYDVERLHRYEDNPRYYASTIIDELNRNSYDQLELISIKVIGRRLGSLTGVEIKQYYDESKFETVNLSYSEFMKDIENQIKHYRSLLKQDELSGNRIIEYGYVIQILENIWDYFIEDIEKYVGYTEMQIDEMVGDIESMAELVCENVYESLELTEWENDILVKVFH